MSPNVRFLSGKSHIVAMLLSKHLEGGKKNVIGIENYKIKILPLSKSEEAIPFGCKCLSHRKFPHLQQSVVYNPEGGDAVGVNHQHKEF